MASKVTQQLNGRTKVNTQPLGSSLCAESLLLLHTAFVTSLSYKKTKHRIMRTCLVWALKIGPGPQPDFPYSLQ